MEFNPSESMSIKNHVMGIMFQGQGIPVDNPFCNQIVYLLLSKIIDTQYLTRKWGNCPGKSLIAPEKKWGN